MNRITYIAMGLLVLSCKTVSREEFGIKMSDISVKLPDNLKDYEAKASFSRLDSKADAKVIRGQDIKVKLPAGTYKINLTLMNKAGTEEYETCNFAAPYTFSKPQEDAIIDICRKSDRAFVTRTLATKIIPPVSTPPIAGGSGNQGGVTTHPITPITPGENGGGTIPVIPVPPAAAVPSLVPEKTCFGLAATIEEKELQFVIKMTDEIKSEIFDITKVRTCKLIFDIAKPVGKGFAAKSNTFFYTADATTYSSGFKSQIAAFDEEGRKASKCKSVFIKADGSNGVSSVCAFYDTTPATFGTVSEIDKPDYQASCKTATTKLVYEIKLMGLTDKYIETMKISEIRIDKPEVQACL